MTWLFYAITVTVLAASAAIVEKKSLFKIHAMQFSSVLAIVNMLVGLPFLVVADYSSLNLSLVVLMFFASMVGALAFLLVAKSLRHIDISISAPLLALSPALTALLGFLLLGELLTSMQILGILLIVVGSYFVTFKKGDNFLKGITNFVRFKYYRFILFAVFLYSFGSILDKYFLTTYNLEAVTYVAIMQVFIAIHLFVLISVFHRGVKDIKEGFSKAKWLILLVSAFTVGYRFAQAEAFKQVQTGIVIAFKRMSILLVVLVGGELFHEKHLVKKLVASIIMILGVLLIVL